MSVNTQTTLLSKTVEPFLIRKIPSIFTTRNGKTDIVIHKETGKHWGALYDGKRYTIAMILDAKTFQPVRSNLTFPNGILNNLKDWGF